MTGMRLLWVFLGGGLGSCARVAVVSIAGDRLGAGFPYGTLVVNLVGSALLAALVHVSIATALVPADLRVGLAAGVLGGFTTYSAFSQETFALLGDGDLALAAVYVAATLIGGLLACLLGFAAARAIVGA